MKKKLILLLICLSPVVSHGKSESIYLENMVNTLSVIHELCIYSKYGVHGCRARIRLALRTQYIWEGFDKSTANICMSRFESIKNERRCIRAMALDW